MFPNLLSVGVVMGKFCAMMMCVLGLLLIAPRADAEEIDATLAVEQARHVMDRFLVAFNARDESGLADTLLFPHVRIASGDVVVTPNKAQFLVDMDMDAFARRFDWAHSEWDEIQPVQAGADKVHFKVTFSRFNAKGERNATFNSLYVVQQQDGRWGIRARSSFAP